MYRIAICEDEKVFFEAQEKACRDIFDNLNLEYRITTFDNSKDFLTAFSVEHKRYDLILMDIVMDGTNGMELARTVRESDREVTIIFITSSRDYALQGYDVNALHYLLKPIDIDVLERLIVSDYHNKFQNSYLVVKSGAQNLRIHLKDIYALETVGRRVEITLPDRKQYYSGKMVDLLDELPKNQFIRCHQSFAININNIRELTNQAAVTLNGKIVPVSRTFKRDVQKAFLKQMRDS